MILPNKIDTKDKQIIAVDWSYKTVHVCEGLNKPIKTFCSLSEMAPHYKNAIMAIESTADSYDLDDRLKDIKVLQDNNIEVHCSNPIYTARHRKENNIEKTNENDSRCIYQIFTEKKLVWNKFKPLVEVDKLRNDINKVIRDDRWKNDGAEILKLSQQLIPEFNTIPLDFLPFLYTQTVLKVKKPKKARECRKVIGRILLCAIKIRKLGKGRKEFIRQLGNYGQGYGCMLRSEFYQTVDDVLESRLKKLGLDVKECKHKSSESKAINKEIMKMSSKMAKWLWKLTEKL
jgi:hypothetical protein